jgi:ABC-2 type transport system ATP-binding protein
VIALRDVSKKYIGIEIDERGGSQSGISLWVKNIAHLTGNKASSTAALNNVSLTVGKGEIFGIYGANGAGKTTLIKILSGLLLPTSGTVEIDGHSENKQIKNTVSYISTNGWMGLEWQLTARENLFLYGNIFGISGKKLAARCDEALLAVGMTEAQNKFISQLSAGMRQKITIARGLILDRPVVFYDEPSVSLDVPSSQSLRELIVADAALNNRTALIASHNADDLAICGRIALLSKGRILAVGTLAELAEPLSNMQIIEVRYLNQDREIDWGRLPGVITVTHGTVEGKRDVQLCKINAHKHNFSYDNLIDFLIENNMATTSIRSLTVSIQEIYEYYLSA